MRCIAGYKSAVRSRALQIASITLVAIAALEVGVDLYQRGQVPDDSDWRELAEHLRAKRKDKDIIISDQLWIEPLVRRFAGSMISLGEAGRSDLLGFERAWSIAVGQEPAKPEAGAEHVELLHFGNLELALYRLPKADLAFDFVENFVAANVVRNGAPCARQDRSPQGGGLGRGPMRPAQSWVCPGQGEWIGRTTIEDLNYQPRRCIWQRAVREAPTRVVFSKVPPASRLVVHAGHYLRDERTLDSPPVQLNVFVDGELAGQMTHRDGDGWKRFEVALDKQGDAEIAFEVLSPSREQNFCWAAKALR